MKYIHKKVNGFSVLNWPHISLLWEISYRFYCHFRKHLSTRCQKMEKNIQGQWSYFPTEAFQSGKKIAKFYQIKCNERK